MSTPAAVEYRVDLSQKNAHLYALEATYSIGGDFIDLRLPVWTPGSYLVREFERHVQEVRCEDGEGRALPVTKSDKSSWRVDARNAKRIVARYRVYAWDLTVRAAHLDDTHAFWNGACLFLYADALRDKPHRVTVSKPDTWHITVGLDADAQRPNSYVARDYDELVDSPFEVGTHELIEFTAQNRPHRIAVWGRLDKSRAELAADITRIIDAANALFEDEPPYPDYHFILLLAPNCYGGLEHCRSSTLLASPYTFFPRKKYEEFLELVSHEYFHLWNVKRIRPEVLGPFDYSREAYTRALWMMEGITSYYDRHLLVRSGIQSPKRYLDKLAEELGKIAETPGRLVHNLEEASYDAWIKYYRPDENSANSSISYYLKGGCVATLLDLEIRQQSGGKRSLDDVMRALWKHFRETGRGFDETRIQEIFEVATGTKLGAFFDRYIRGTEELDAATLLGHVGLTIALAEEEDKSAGAVWLGITTRQSGDRTIIATQIAGAPAEKAGLYAGDEILAIDGYRLDAGALSDRLAQKREGDIVQLTVFRRDALRTVDVTLANRPRSTFAISAAKDASAEQKAALVAWLGHSIDAVEGDDSET